MERQPNPDDPAYRDQSTRRRLEEKKSKTPGEQLEKEGGYLDTGELDQEGKPLLSEKIDVESLTNQQKQKEDAKKWKKFDDAVAGAKSKEDLIEAGKIRKDIEERLGNNWVSLSTLAFETFIGIGADVTTPALLGTPFAPLYYPINYGIGYGTNILGQWLRGEEIKQGRAHAAGAFQTIPLGTTAKGLKGIARATGKGAVGSVVGEQVAVGIDEKRVLTPEEVGYAGAFGGTFGGISKSALDNVDITGLRNTLNRLSKPRQVIVNPDGTLFIANDGIDGAKPLMSKGKSSSIDPPDSFDAYETDLTKFYAGENVQFPVRVLDEVPQSIRGTMAYDSGLVDGVFDFDKWLGKSLYGKRYRSRDTVSKMQAPFGTDVNFEQYRDNVLLPEFRKEWGPILDKLKIPRSSLQAHHIFAIRASAGLYDGLKFGSKEWADVTNTLLEKYIRTGDMPKNLMPLVGSTSDIGTPHYITHRYIDDIIGPTGETFFTKEVREEMKRNHKFRIKTTKDFAEKMKTAEGVAVQAQEVWDRIYGPGQVIPEELVEELSSLPMTVDPKYRTDAKLEELVRQVFSQIEEFPFPESMSRKEFIKNWLPQFEGKGFDALRRMFEVDLDLTPEQAMQTPLGYRLQKYLQDRVVRNPIKKKFVKRKKK